jgi:superfamily II DNA helicase RecQ
VDRLQDMAVQGMFPVSEKFRRQLREAFQPDTLPETDAYILERTCKASRWFREQFSLVFDDLVRKFQVETDNKELARRLDNVLSNLRQDVRVKQAGIASCENGFSTAQYLLAISQAEMEDTPGKKQKLPAAPEYSEADIAHPEIFQQLKDWRSARAREQGVPPYQILHQRVLIQIAVALPVNTAELKAIKGVGKKTIENYGEVLLDMIAAYREKHEIEVVKQVINRKR